MMMMMMYDLSLPIDDFLESVLRSSEVGVLAAERNQFDTPVGEIQQWVQLRLYKVSEYYSYSSKPFRLELETIVVMPVPQKLTTLDLSL